jgi:hypothetical protein
LITRLAAGLLVSCAFLVSCSNPPASPAPTRTPTPTAVPVQITPTPTLSGADLPLTVGGVGASVSPSGGFVAFALISNPSSRVASEVTIEIAAVTASGAQLAHASGTIARIDPSTTQAVSVRLPDTPPTPSAFKASLTGNQWLDAGSPPEPIQVVNAAFVQDPRTPTVRVRVANHAAAVTKANIIAVCLDEAGAVRGGGSAVVSVAASASGQDTFVPVSIPVVPASCQGYALAQ